MIARDLGYQIREAAMPREFLYMADEAFFCGTAVEITPIKLDRPHPGGRRRARPGHRGLQKQFFGIINGDVPDTHRWLTPVKALAAR